MNRACVSLFVSLIVGACSGPPIESAGPAGSTPATPPPIASVAPAIATQALPRDVDDPAIWLNTRDPAQSLLIATMKVAAPDGALAVYGLDGKLRQLLKGPDRPNNVDVEYGLDLDGKPTDIAVLTERLAGRLRAYAIAPDGSGLRDISPGGMPILEGARGAEGGPMGIGLYKRPKDGAVFAIVSPKAGPKDNYLWQYRLTGDGAGRVKATFVRRFGAFSGVGEIEAVVVDDELGYVYYADEVTGIHKWHADPDAAGANTELALFGTTGYRHEREGLGIYTLPGGTGYVISVDQLSRQSVFHVYKREGEPGRPHDHSAVVLTFKGGADRTDGVDVSSAAFGPQFPDGLLVAMNSAGRNFLVFRWRDIADAARPPLTRSGAFAH